MATPILQTVTILAVLLFFTVVGPLLLFLPMYLRRRVVTCPERHLEDDLYLHAEVRVKPVDAALSAAYGAPRLKVSRCSLLAASQTCDGACLGRA